MRSGSTSLAHAISYTNDPVGRATQTQLADGRLLGAAYDGNGNTTDVTLPSPESHAFTFTPADLLASYAPPSVGTGPVAIQYAYDVDRNLYSDPAGRSRDRRLPRALLPTGLGRAKGAVAARSKTGKNAGIRPRGAEKQA